jgi:hypothetical protein
MASRLGEVRLGRELPLTVVLCVSAVGVVLSVTVTVAVNGPAAVGFPLIKPLPGSMETPLGNPLALQWYGVVPPAAVHGWLYG